MEDWRMRRRGQIAYYNLVSHSAIFSHYVTITSAYFHGCTCLHRLLQHTVISIDLAICMVYHTLSPLYVLSVLL